MISRLLMNSFLVLSLIASCAYANPTVSDITDLVLITGQSNVRGSQTEYDSAIDSIDLKVFAYTDNDNWEVADLHQVWDVDGWHPGNGSMTDTTRQPYNNLAFHFAKTVVERDPQRVVGIIIASAPGEGILHWEPGSSFYQTAKTKVIDALNAQGVKSGLDGILWHQGETDWQFNGTSDIDASEAQRNYEFYYPDKLNALISAFRNESWFSGGKPFICGETKRAPVNGRLMALNNDGDTWTGCVQGADLCTRERETEACNDVAVLGTHFDASGLRTIGQRYGNKYLDIIEANEVQPPALTSPQAGGILSNGNGVEVFEWTAHSTDVSQWWLSIGSSASRLSHYHNSGSLTAGTLSTTVSGLPRDGSDILVRLWYQIAADSTWYFIDSSFVAFGSTPDFTSPQPGASLAGAVDTISWEHDGNGVTDYWLEMGSSVGEKDYFNSGNLGGSLNVVANGLPTDGVSEVFTRLWYRFGATSPWLYIGRVFVAGTEPAPLPVINSHTSPGPLTDTAGTELFAWNENGSGATSYWVYAGSVAGGRQFFDSGNIGSDSTATIFGLPTSGESVWIRLWYRQGSTGAWQYIDEEYIAVNTIGS